MGDLATTQGTEISFGPLTWGRRGITVNGRPSMEMIRSVVAYENFSYDSTPWAIGDILLLVENLYGEDEMSQLSADLEDVPESSQRAYRRVADHFDKDERSYNLGWSFYQEVTKGFINKRTAKELLDRAERNDWTLSQLRQEVKLLKGEMQQERQWDLYEAMDYFGKMRERLLQKWPEDSLDQLLTSLKALAQEVNDKITDWEERQDNEPLEPE